MRREGVCQRTRDEGVLLLLPCCVSKQRVVVVQIATTVFMRILDNY